MADINVLRIRRNIRLLRQAYHNLNILENLYTWHTILEHHKTPNILSQVASFTLFAIAKYSAFLVESVTHCVLENRLTAEPPHDTTPSDTDFLFIALLA